jgi:class 3 adenylate cyclase
MQSALQTNEIVTSIFPDFIKSRLIANTQSSRISRSQNAKATHNNFHLAAPKQQIRNMLGRKVDMANIAFDQSEPIADFFPNVTVIFADIAGFTAWSSEREPTQVFQLLESVYQTFDQIAEKHGVFKVETIGDCYVAVTGLPEPQTDHAVRMAKFAHEIMLHMHEAAVSLESQLGPGTGSLSIRVGMHSGSVTGGVLRGDKARFQLFGDTMNTAARMQTTGQVNKIQVSQTTAALLDDQCSHWLTKRDRKVSVKGKGDMQTFWVDPTCLEPSDIQTIDPSIPTSVASGSKETPLDIMATRQQAAENSVERLVDWNADLLERFLKNVVANRKATRRRQQRRRSSQLGWVAYSGKQPIDDVTEVIAMSDFCAKKADEQAEPTSVELSETVRAQLKDYVRQIAAMYRDNPFHNFEHASHVAMSANKIIKRIVRPDDVDYNQENVRKKDRKKTVAQQIHQSTFGISSDALMQFAVAFSAIIHDVDHTGVSNAQLVKENDEVAIRYDGKCVAEQHSVHVAWELLKKEQFSDFRACIYDSDEEKLRFRQLIVNAVIATDIADRDNQMLRKNRWNKAFSESSTGNRGNDAGDDISCKATVVFEYIIQASDVAHTMQHWHVYNQWNERLFEERYKAFLAGREEKDPSLGWYNGEIWFFDNYIIPLARKLETCGVFGVSSEEYLNYALENRHEWELKGHEIVQNLIEKYTVDRVVDALDIV